MKKIFLFLVVIFVLLQVCSGQISEGGLPYFFNRIQQETIETYTLNAKFTLVEEHLRTDLIEGETFIFPDPIIGEVFPVNVNAYTHGKWSVNENGDSLWMLQINSTLGEYMMLICNAFFLPEGSKLFVYTPDRSQILGAFTAKNNTSLGKFSTTPIKTKSILIEYFKPVEVNENLVFNIKSIGLITHDFTKVLTKEFGGSGDCMVNAMCPEFDEWCEQRRSVALIIRVIEGSGQIRWCSGSIITNERKDGKPFLLTAFHCIDNEPENNSIEQNEIDEIQNWIFIFNYQSQECDNPINEPSLLQSISGASYIRSHDNSDYALLQLNSKPPANYNAFYSGWNNDDMTNTGVCIHHPSGDIKKISEWDKKISLLPNYWRVEYTVGSTEAGSSGSGLFNSSGYIVGQLKMGLASCDNNKSDYFGRFDKSWHKFGLCYELNPNGDHGGGNQFYLSVLAGDETCKDDWRFENVNDLHTSDNVSFLFPETMGTRMYDGVYNAVNAITAMNVEVLSSTFVSFIAGNMISLRPGFHAENGSRFIAQIGQCFRGCNHGFKKANYIDYIISENTYKETENSIVSDVLTQTPQEGLGLFTEPIFTIAPNPNYGKFKLIGSFETTDIYEIQIIDTFGQIVFQTCQYKGEEIDIVQFSKGIYYICVVTINTRTTKKIIVL